jgi:membrane protein
VTERGSRISRVARALRAKAGAHRRGLLERRHQVPFLDAVLDVVERDRRIGGGILAGALAYQIFFFLLPLGVAAVGVLGAVSAATGRPPEDVGEDVGLRGLVTSSVADAASSNAWWYAIVIGVPFLVYVSSGLLRVLAGTHRLAWSLPAGGPRPSLGVTIAFLGTMLAFFLVTGVAAAVRARSPFGGLGTTLAAGLIFGIGWLGLSVAFEHRELPWRALVPGAVLFALGAEALHLFFVYVLARLAAGKEDAYGELGMAAALLFGLYLTGRLIVATAVLNATLWERRGASRAPGPA